MFDSEEIKILQSSWDSIEDKIRIPQEHYKYLFKNHPELMPLFTTESKIQHQRFLNSYDNVIRNLDNTEEVMHYYKVLGFQHKAYKVKRKHYPIIVKSVLNAISIVFGDKFEGELKSAWENFINTIAETMMSGLKLQYISPKSKKRMESFDVPK